MKAQFDGTLTMDTERGVVYFHDKETGECLVRLSGVPIKNRQQIDIRLSEGGIPQESGPYERKIMTAQVVG